MKKNNGAKKILFFDERAESETVGHVILLGLTILGISMLSIFSIPAILSMQDNLNAKNVEQAFTVFDSRASRTALAEAPMQITEINTKGGDISVLTNSSSQPSYITIELSNGSSIINSMTIPMGKIVYAQNDREVAYEGGGVWSKYHSKSVMISPPEFHYNGVTLTLPIVNISGSSSVGGQGRSSLNIEKKGYPNRIYPNSNSMNPIPENVTQINITIKSEYYDAWGAYFKSIPLTNVHTYDNEKKVIVSLEAPPLVTKFNDAATASQTIFLGQGANINSYNSSIGSYSISQSGNGSIRANVQITIRNTAVVNGSAKSGGSIDCGNGNSCGEIKRDAYGIVASGINVSGQRKPAVGVLYLPGMDNTVNGKINSYSPPNSGLPCFSGPQNKSLNPGAPCTISSGNYYLTKINVVNTDLIFDTLLGSVNIAADIPNTDYVFMKNANITVTGPNPVRIYLAGGGGNYQGNSISMSVGGAGGGDAASVNYNLNPNQNSSLFQVYSKSGYQIQFQQQSKFVGFVYAPQSEIYVQQGAQIYGAMVGKLFSVTQSQDIHFDESLKDFNTELDSGTILMYLHITRNDVEVRLD